MKFGVDVMLLLSLLPEPSMVEMDPVVEEVGPAAAVPQKTLSNSLPWNLTS
jgi:hypothetical protein